jgi:catechol 2,3-dioxygenase-like lactoylglutathione lyase family enzyme
MTRNENEEQRPMLADKPIDVVLLARDLQASRQFYADKLGLEIVSEDQGTIVFACGGDSRIILSASTIGTADEQTQASWRVDDLAAELAELRSRGVQIMEYDTPGLKTDNGIFDTGDALHAWIVDPGGNTLGIDQPK